MRPLLLAIVVTASLTVPFASAKPAKSKSKTVKPDSGFQKKLVKDEPVLHALDRLTYGQRPGDFARVKKIGVKRWVEQQLHPEQIAEDPALEQRLRPLETLRLTPIEVWRQYPQQQSVLGAIKGKPALPDDPLYRANVFRYAAYYRLNDDAALQPLIPLDELMPAEQVRLLRSGKPDQKREVLNSLPADKLDEYLIAMGQPLRNQLQGVAPVALRRRMMAL